MEVIGYGLALPLSDHDTIKDCVNIYCEWLSALLPEPKTCVPSPIVQDPNLYARKIVQHLYHLFVPRPGDGSEMIHRQAVLCHRVLRRIQDIVKQSSIMATETWESFLGEMFSKFSQKFILKSDFIGFLLAINDALLAPPAAKEDVGDQLCERVLGNFLLNGGDSLSNFNLRRFVRNLACGLRQILPFASVVENFARNVHELAP